MAPGLVQIRPAFLASVTSAGEALMALSAGAAIIDCKDPALGALGALTADAIRSVVEHVRGRAPVSATLGDLPNDPQILLSAAEAAARTGADFVKIGFFGDGDARPAIAALSDAKLGGSRLVAVLMADRAIDLSMLSDFKAAGFAAVMLDTADKNSGALPDVLAPQRLSAFVATAHAHGLVAGLAGSLKLDHIAVVEQARPDIIGFRGALCAAGRTSALDAARCIAIGRAMAAAAVARNATLANA